jgi:hypothetical protein
MQSLRPNHAFFFLGRFLLGVFSSGFGGCGPGSGVEWEKRTLLGQ